MGHDNHAVMSPAHRRNQNPMSPSASLFKRSAPFPREEIDLSWMALLKRHRFLLLTLALLTFLCTVYLYFAIKLGTDTCSGLAPKEAASCRLKRSKVKASSHGQKGRRGLLGFKDLPTGVPGHYSLRMNSMDAFSWVEYMTVNGDVRKVLSLGCKKGGLTDHFASKFMVTKPTFECERPLQNPASSYDLILCDNCNLKDFTSGGWKLSELSQLLRQGGYFLWISETLDGEDETKVPGAGLTLLSRVHGMAIWQR